MRFSCSRCKIGTLGRGRRVHRDEPITGKWFSELLGSVVNVYPCDRATLRRCRLGIEAVAAAADGREERRRVRAVERGLSEVERQRSNHVGRVAAIDDDDIAASSPAETAALTTQQKRSSSNGTNWSHSGKGGQHFSSNSTTLSPGVSYVLATSTP